MGFSLGWIAVKGKSRESVLKEIGLEPTGEREEFPESDATGLALPNDWHVIITNLDNDDLTHIWGGTCCERLSRQCNVIHCYLYETTMMSWITGWKNRKKVWSIQHDGGNKGIFHLETSGNLPSQFDAINDRLISEQKANGGESAMVDCIFDIPIELGYAITGYRHDRSLTGTKEKPFEVLIPSPPESAWHKIQRLFKRSEMK